MRHISADQTDCARGINIISYLERHHRLIHFNLLHCGPINADPPLPPHIHIRISKLPGEHMDRHNGTSGAPVQTRNAGEPVHSTVRIIRLCVVKQEIQKARTARTAATARSKYSPPRSWDSTA